MTLIKSYHRPQSVGAAVELLARPGVTMAVIAGGTYVNAYKPEEVDEVVDLQATGLDYARHDGERLTMGAMTRLQSIVDWEDTPELLRDTARREGANTFRNQATLGGVVVGADPESELLAALLVFEADVRVQNSGGARTVALSDFLADIAGSLAGGIITEISVATGGTTAADRVARTPADKPIVAAVARKKGGGQILLALCGVANSPILIDPDQVASLNPPADFRGSSEYRREMAERLSGRVLNRLED
ncbi:MAG: hypothetical protein GY759_21655 [Chloroflexi bacterium]|nr:hypothetical protein [Chloroflexota bacterium]